MRLSILAATLAVLALPVTAAPHKIGRCVPKSSSLLPSPSSSSDAPVASSSVEPEVTLSSPVPSPSSEPSEAPSASMDPSPAPSSAEETSTEEPTPSESISPSATSSEEAPSSTPEAQSSTDAASPSTSESASPSATDASPSPSSEPAPSPTESEPAQPTATRVLQAPEDKADGSSDEFRDQILNLHNQVRSQFNSSNLNWDQSLADSAAAWVDQCNFGASNTPYTSENTAAGQGSNLLPYLFSQWSQERDVYDMAHPGLTGQNGGATGHFTQIVWKATTNLGCAWKACPADKIQQGWTGTATYLVCQYSPPGNYAPGGDGTKQSFCENVGCNEDVRASIALPDAVAGYTVE